MPEKNSSKHIVKFLFDQWKISPKLCFGMALTQVFYAILTMTIAPIFVSQLLTQIAKGSSTMANSLWLLVCYAVILFMGDVIMPRITIGMAFIAETKMQSNMANRVLSHLAKKSLGYHANRMSGGIVSDANKLNGAIERFWDTLIFTAIPISTTVISVCIALGFILWQYAVALAILSAIIIFVIIKSQSSISFNSKQVAEKSSAMTAYFADVVTNIATVKAFAGEKNELENYKEHVNNWYQSLVKEMKSVLIVTGSFGTMMTIMNITAFIAAIIATEHHIATIGSVYLIISYTLNVVSQLWQVSNTTRNYIRVIGDAAPMLATLDDEIEISDPIKPLKCAINKGKIELKDITFTHNENTKPLFENFSFNVNSGEQVGLIGRSGSGKTSLTRLLLRFSDVEKGKIFIDNQDITKITQDDLHRSIAYVPQEPILFHRSLRENIAYGKPNATEEEIYSAAEKANSIDFIKDLPEGFDTIVGERGIKLSGGQRQRIAIARAILKDAPILVLDEATSALDSESEALIQDALKKLMKGRTSIVIAHRLSTIAKLDRIVVLDNGKILEHGSHKELLANNGIYASLWLRQSGGFIEE